MSEHIEYGVIVDRTSDGLGLYVGNATDPGAISDDAIACYAFWCRLNPRFATDVALLRRVLAAYARTA